MQIRNPVCKDRMRQKDRIFKRLLLVQERMCFFTQVFSFQHRDLCQIFRGGLFFLICLQCLCLCDHSLQLFCGKRSLFLCKHLFQFFTFSALHSFFRKQGYDRFMCIIQNLIFHKLFKIISLYQLLQCVKSLIRFNMHKWSLVIIQPAVQCLQTIHQPFWIRPEICFLIFKLIAVNSRKQGIFINAVLYLLS